MYKCICTVQTHVVQGSAVQFDAIALIHAKVS